MKITEQQKEEIIAKIGQSEFDKITKPEPCEGSIYAFKGLYLFKAHRVLSCVDRYQYAWVSLNDSECFANGRYDSLKELLDTEPSYVKLESVSQLADWIKDNA